METVSKQARKLLKSLVKVRNERDYVIYENHHQLIDSDELAIAELIELSFLKGDHAGNYRITNKGLIFLRQYKTFTRQVWLTSFWLPIAVSFITTVITLLVNYLIFK
ncbi:hypothetical protein [Streptococcus equinus]|uniref:hypothetical protein n=1 Tax=Streptococcus equinus TaxID=1335 RepID=UPI0008E4F683|nr:hypothetical protein [Streptococcus equinus]QBX24794.1 hypothetical protein Javan210_0009 [Streptococcus phage Javan210]SFF75945.1 hypothetical protein SAMN05216385_0347 [Streptococcus equinus]